MNEDLSPAALRRLEERRELIRLAAQRVIDDHFAGRIVDPETMVWARQIVARIRPLARQLGTGAPS